MSNATLNGSVIPNSFPVEAFFEWGFDTNYGQSTASTNFPAGTSLQNYSKGLTSLLSGTTYHFRAVGQYYFGTKAGVDRQFTTSGSPPPDVWEYQWSVSRSSTDCCVESCDPPWCFNLNGVSYRDWIGVPTGINADSGGCDPYSNNSAQITGCAFTILGSTISGTLFGDDAHVRASDFCPGTDYHAPRQQNLYLRKLVQGGTFGKIYTVTGTVDSPGGFSTGFIPGVGEGLGCSGVLPCVWRGIGFMGVIASCNLGEGAYVPENIYGVQQFGAGSKVVNYQFSVPPGATRYIYLALAGPPGASLSVQGGPGTFSLTVTATSMGSGSPVPSFSNSEGHVLDEVGDPGGVILQTNIQTSAAADVHFEYGLCQQGPLPSLPAPDCIDGGSMDGFQRSDVFSGGSTPTESVGADSPVSMLFNLPLNPTSGGSYTYSIRPVAVIGGQSFYGDPFAVTVFTPTEPPVPCSGCADLTADGCDTIVEDSRSGFGSPSIPLDDFVFGGGNLCSFFDEWLFADGTNTLVLTMSGVPTSLFGNLTFYGTSGSATILLNGEDITPTPVTNPVGGLTQFIWNFNQSEPAQFPECDGGTLTLSITVNATGVVTDGSNRFRMWCGHPACNGL